MGTRYDWAGSKIMPFPLVRNKRSVHPPADDDIWIDVRDLIMAPNRKQILEVFKRMKVDEPDFAKEVGSFDQRARRCWKLIAKGNVDQNASNKGNGAPGDAAPPANANDDSPIKYKPDPNPFTGEKADFWQFPSETIACRGGDCEDMAILLASLMVGTGISPYCIRVVVGRYHQSISGEARDLRLHAWVVYKTERGPWAFIDPTWSFSMYKESDWHIADGCDDGISDVATSGLLHHYNPSYTFNSDHAWQIFVLGPSDLA